MPIEYSLRTRDSQIREPLVAYDLRTNDRNFPREVGADGAIRFSWRLKSQTAGDAQVAASVALYRCDPASEERLVWSSRTRATGQVSIEYDGPPLTTATSYVWELSLSGHSGDSVPVRSNFETGLGASDWRAKWIGRGARENATLKSTESLTFASDQMIGTSSPLQLRREFDLESEAIRGRAFVSARGIYQIFVNGQRIGDQQLAPGWLDYENLTEYQAYDITPHLRIGANVVALEVADGWWSGYVGFDYSNPSKHYGASPQAIVQLSIQTVDGSTSTIVSDETGWREEPGHIVYADLLMGEYHDLRSQTQGWQSPGFDDTHWGAISAEHVDARRLTGQQAEPVKIVAAIKPLNVVTEGDGPQLVDFGQNLVGHVRLKIRRAVAGDVVRIRHGETQNDGELYTENLRSAASTDVVVISADGDYVFEPTLTMHGFRYCEILGLRGALDPDDVEAIVVSSALPPAGTFESSSPLLTQLYSNITWGVRGNFVSVPTDCPQRDERLGWTADMQIIAPTAAYLYDVSAFVGRWTAALERAQDNFGSVPDFVPFPPKLDGFREAAPAWGDAVIHVPWMLYRWYGDTARLRESFPHMARWLDYVTANNPSGVWTSKVGQNYGDWLSVDEVTEPALVATAYFARSAAIAASAAAVLGLEDERERFNALHNHVRSAFVAAFVEQDGRIAGGTQSGYLLALAWDLLPPELRELAADHLVNNIQERGNRLATGFLGVNLLCPTLCRIGRPDLAVDLVLQEEFPSWGYSIRQGATTIWERWDGWTEQNGYQDAGMNSFNHYSLGSVGEWLMSGIAGIAQSSDSVGFEKLRIAPIVPRQLSWASGSLQTLRGLVRTRWERLDQEVRFDIEIPPGASARFEYEHIKLDLDAGVHELTIPHNAIKEDQSSDIGGPTNDSHS